MRRITGMRILTAIAVLCMVYLLAIPLITQLLTSLRGPNLPFGVPSAEWTLSNYDDLLALGSNLPVTIIQTGLFVGFAALISTLLAFWLAWLVVRTDMPGRVLISALVLVPFIIPPIVRAQSFILMLAPETGVLNQLLRIFPWWAGEAGPIFPFSFA